MIKFLTGGAIYVVSYGLCQLIFWVSSLPYFLPVFNIFIVCLGAITIAFGEMIDRGNGDHFSFVDIGLVIAGGVAVLIGMTIL